MEYEDFIKKLCSISNSKFYCGGGLQLEKAVAYPEEIVIIEIQYTGNMGYGIESVNEEIVRHLGLYLEDLRSFSFKYSESGSPDYLWNGSYRIQL